MPGSVPRITQLISSRSICSGAPIAVNPFIHRNTAASRCSEPMTSPDGEKKRTATPAAGGAAGGEEEGGAAARAGPAGARQPGRGGGRGPQVAEGARGEGHV